jgi:YYY domain-containing protein
MLKKFISLFLMALFFFSAICLGRDFLWVILWWFYLLILGIIFLPITGRYFDNFFDRGYLFSKIIGILVLAYVVWIFSSLKLLPISREVLFLCMVIITLLIFIPSKGRHLFRVLLKETRSIFVAEEILFLLGLIFWAFIRTLQPNIQGLEKFMDFGFVNSILRTSFMPPMDMWYAGENINYYYFGHYVCALLTKLTNIPSAITYNLMIATLFSFAFSLTFSLAGNLVYLRGKGKFRNIVIAGLLSALVLTFSANLHTFIYAYALPWAKSLGIYQGEIKPYWFPDATRYIGYHPPTEDKTIHEFPLYSFVVSDLHGHVSNIPVVLTFLAVILLWLTKPLQAERDKIKPFFSFLLAILYMTNTWDFPIYLIIVMAIYVYKNLSRDQLSWRLMGSTLLQGGETLFLSLLLALPFILNFTSFYGGIGWVKSRTPIYQFLVLWGIPLFFTFSFLILLIFIEKRSQSNRVKEGLWVKITRWISGLKVSDLFVLILSLSAIGLIALPEIIYVKDIYPPSYHRGNTMFKLTYQAFMMFSIAIGYITVHIFSKRRRALNQNLLELGALVLLYLGLLYPLWAIPGYYGTPKPSHSKGLNGLTFLGKIHSGDDEAIQWLNRNVKGQPILLEANGDSYTDYGRISMATGLPTLQGWFVHEWLWRGNPDRVAQRVNEVATVYESEDIAATFKILQKYQVQFIIIGTLERTKFKNLKEDKIAGLGELVFDSSGTKIIRVDGYR